MNNKNKLPKILSLFVYSCPIICLTLFFIGRKVQTDALLFLSVIPLLILIITFPFINKGFRWARVFSLGICLFFIIILFNSAIGLPVIFALPIFPLVRIYLFLVFLYFCYFFTVLLANQKVLEHFAIMEDKVMKDGVPQPTKRQKYRKMFILGIIVIFLLFSGMSIMVVLKIDLVYKKIAPQNISQLIEKLKTEHMTNTQENGTNIQDSIEKTFYKVKFKVSKKLKFLIKDNQIIIQKNNVKLIKMLVFKYNRDITETFLKKVVRRNYVMLAASSPKISKIEADVFFMKNNNGAVCYFKVNKFREIIAVYKTKNHIIYVIADIYKNTFKHVYSFFKTLNISELK